MSMPVKVIFANNRLRNYQYLILTPKLVCIDPYNGQQILASLESEHSIDLLMNTHQHHDHVKGNPEIIASGAVWVDKKECKLGRGYALQRLSTPGHTMDSDSFLLIKDGVNLAIFGGDTLFVGGVGNCYNGGDPEVLGRTLIELDNILENQIRIYPGHDYWENNKQFALSNYDYTPLKEAIILRDSQVDEFTTWEEEKGHNPFLRVLFDQVFRDKYFTGENPVSAFCQMRALRDKF